MQRHAAVPGSGGMVEGATGCIAALGGNNGLAAMVASPLCTRYSVVNEPRQTGYCASPLADCNGAFFAAFSSRELWRAFLHEGPHTFAGVVR